MHFFQHKRTKTLWIYALLLICSIGSIIFSFHNYDIYKRPIAKIIDSKVIETSEVTDEFDNKDKVFKQHLKAEVKNGAHQGEIIVLANKYSTSGAYDEPYKKGNDVFISFDKEKSDDGKLKGSISGVKRDKYTVIIAWFFFFALILVGKRQGLFTSISLMVNIIILSYALDIYVKTGMNLLWICGILVILFTIISLLLVNGMNEKSYTAIIATIGGTFLGLLITFLVMRITDESGLHYEEMQFLTRPYNLIFLAGLFIGSMGAVMDVAISISSAMFEMYEADENVPITQLKKSGFTIGKDIIGTMTNILFFAYVSGSIPILILYITNRSPLGFTLSINLSLEVARALAGGIGIVLTIPISLYIAIFFIQRKRARS